MAVTEKTISSLVDRQLPDFVKSDHPQFKIFLEKYYQWMERTGSEENYNYGNTIYHIMNAEKYRDIDETIDPFFSFFKEEFLPYFPEKTALDITKILKSAREFYSEKGSEESVKWLFRALFDIDVDIFYPKKQILIASDGKWKLPQAFNITLSAQNQNIIPNLLEKHRGTGSESAATCVIESANKTVDKTFGNEILEIYVSNVTREFITGENLVIEYVDENGTDQIFSEKIVAQISGIKVDSNIKTDPEQKRRGLSYNVGDPVIVYGGLDNTQAAADAIAKVSNVTAGSIESVSISFPGYGFRTYSNTEAIALLSPGDDPNANASVDVRVAAINTGTPANDSQNTFKEIIVVDKIPIELMKNVTLNTPDYSVFTLNVRNAILNVTEADSADKYQNYEYVWANGSSYQTANFKGIILTPNTSGFGQNGANVTGSLFLYSIANTESLSTTGFLVGQQLYTANTDKSFTVNSVTDAEVDANINSQLLQCLKTEELVTGGLALFNVLNGGYGFVTNPIIKVDSYFDTTISENYSYDGELADKKLWRQTIGSYGKIAHVYIQNGGTGYANGDQIVITGRGYGFTGYVNVNTSGSIVRTTITNRGEGYYGAKTINVTSSGGSNGALQAYGFGEGETIRSVSPKSGRVLDIRLVSRGFDYISTPLVSLKVADMVINPPENPNYNKGQFVYQGTYNDPIFTAIIDSYNPSNKVLRLYNYSGNSRDSFNKFLVLHVTADPSSSTELEDLQFTVNTAVSVPAPSEYTVSELSNPYWYGNGSAKAYAEFYKGLIKYPGFYINNDGFVSSDKKLQDGKTYQNYSYVIESEKSIREYRNPIKDIVHPVGMYMLGRTITDSYKLEKTKTGIFEGKIVTSPLINGNVTANAFSTSNEVYFFDVQDAIMANTAYANDLIIIGNTNRYIVKQLVENYNVSTDSVTLESNTMFIGDGRFEITENSNTFTIVGNTNSITSTLQVSDNVRFNVNNTIFLAKVDDINSNQITINIANTLITTSNSNILYQVYPTYDNVEFQIIHNSSN